MPSAEEVKQLEGVTAAQHRFRLSVNVNPPEGTPPDNGPSSASTNPPRLPNEAGAAGGPFLVCFCSTGVFSDPYSMPSYRIATRDTKKSRLIDARSGCGLTTAPDSRRYEKNTTASSQCVFPSVLGHLRVPTRVLTASRPETRRVPP